MIGPAIAPHLSTREQQFLYLIAEEGLAYKEIAERMGLTLGTIKVYAGILYKKFGFIPSGRGQAQLHMTIWYWQQRIPQTETQGLGQS